MTIGVSFETLQTEYWVAGFEAIKAELQKRNIAMLDAIADGDANRRLEQVKNFIARKVDGIIAVPKDAKTIIPMIKAANEANIPIVLYNRPADKSEAKSVAVIADNFSITKATVEYLAEEAKRSGRKYKAMILLGDLGDLNATGRRDGFEAAIYHRVHFDRKPEQHLLESSAAVGRCDRLNAGDDHRRNRSVGHFGDRARERSWRIRHERRPGFVWRKPLGNALRCRGESVNGRRGRMAERNGDRKAANPSIYRDTHNDDVFQRICHLVDQVELQNPSQAGEKGIAFIHQELNLFTNLSIEENIFITSFPRRRSIGIRFIDRKTIRAKTQSLLDLVNLRVSPETLVADLSPGERQLVEIAKALNIDAKLIIFDEPTTSLTAREIGILFTLIEQLRSSGISMIYISHVLKDIYRLCDDIVVLRDGTVAGSGRANEFTAERLISLMVGRSLDRLYPQREQSQSAEVIFEVESLSQPGVIKDIGFKLHRGELLGITGLMGSGRTELARIL